MKTETLKTEADIQIPPKPKREIETLIDQLKKVKKRPQDWCFVPRRKHHEGARVLLEDGESVLVGDGQGGFRSKTTKAPLTLRISQVKSVTAKGELIGGYRPRAEADWTAEEVLEELIALSLNPACEIVPYEAREMGREAKDAQSELISERRKRQEAEAKLAELDEKGVSLERVKELERQVEELTKPAKR